MGSASNNHFLGRILIQEGMLIRFSPQTLFGKNTEKHHFGVVVNANRGDNSIGIIVGTTSNVLGTVSFASSRGLDVNTVVVVGAGAHRHFGKQTAFNCNDPKSIHMNQLEIWYQNGLIDVPESNAFIESELLVNLKSGVNLSDMVEERVKKLL